MSLDQKVFVSIEFLDLAAKVIIDQDRVDDILEERCALNGRPHATITKGEAEAWRVNLMEDLLLNGYSNPSKLIRVRDSHYALTNIGREFLVNPPTHSRER